MDLVLLSGCGNDVGLLNLLNAVDKAEVDEMTTSKCGKPVENLLQRILTSFPNSHLIPPAITRSFLRTLAMTSS
jgi:hypothetical protein